MVQPSLRTASSSYDREAVHTTNLKTGLKMKVPADLLYEIVPRESGLAIRRMQAPAGLRVQELVWFWEA